MNDKLDVSILLMTIFLLIILPSEGQPDYCSVHPDHLLCPTRYKYRFGNEKLCEGRRAIPLTNQDKDNILEYFNQRRNTIANNREDGYPRVRDMNQLVWHKELSKAAQILAETCAEDELLAHCPKCLHFDGGKIKAKEFRLSHRTLPLSFNYDSEIRHSRGKFYKHKKNPNDGSIQEYGNFIYLARSVVRYIGCGRIIPSHEFICFGTCDHKSPAFMFEVCLLGNLELIEDSDYPDLLGEYRALLAAQIETIGHKCPKHMYGFSQQYPSLCHSERIEEKEVDEIFKEKKKPDLAKYRSHCDTDPDHALCEFGDPWKYGNKTLCDEGVRLIEMTDSDKAGILAFFNTYRQHVAQGRHPYRHGGPSAANMMELVWKEDLALAAEIMVSSCVRGAHLKCKKCFKFGGTQAAHYITDFKVLPMEENYKNDLKLHAPKFDDYLINSYYGPTPSGSMTYSLITNAKTEFIGCGRVIPSDYLTCNFSTVCPYEKKFMLEICLLTPDEGKGPKKLFEQGFSASRCPYRAVSKNYFGLCARDNYADEPYVMRSSLDNPSYVALFAEKMSFVPMSPVDNPSNVVLNPDKISHMPMSPADNPSNVARIPEKKPKMPKFPVDNPSNVVLIPEKKPQMPMSSVDNPSNVALFPENMSHVWMSPKDNPSDVAHIPENMYHISMSPVGNPSNVALTPENISHMLISSVDNPGNVALSPEKTKAKENISTDTLTSQVSKVFPLQVEVTTRTEEGDDQNSISISTSSTQIISTLTNHTKESARPSKNETAFKIAASVKESNRSSASNYVAKKVVYSTVIYFVVMISNSLIWNCCLRTV